MAVRTTDEIMQLLRDRIGEDTSDDALALIGDVSDTLNSLTSDENIKWKEKYETNDAEWRKKYKERFFSPSNTDDAEPMDDENEDAPKHLTYEALFKTL